MQYSIPVVKQWLFIPIQHTAKDSDEEIIL